MLRLLKENQYFFIPFLLAVIIGTYLLVSIEKGTFVLYFATERKPVIDQIFLWITRCAEEPVYAGIAITAMFIRFRYTIMIALTGILSLVISSGLKSWFSHPRPGYLYWVEHDRNIISYVPGYPANEALNSFPSGHTMSAFALYGLLALLIYNKKWGLPLFLMALLIGISRIVLTQHFLEDVYLGSWCGVLLAMGLYAIHKYFPPNDKRLVDRSILNIRTCLKQKPQP